MLHRLRFAFVEVVLAWIAFDVWESIHSSMVDLPIHWSKTRRQRNDWDRQFVRMTYICLLNTWKILFFRWLSNLLIKREFVTNFKCLTDRTNDMNCFILEQFNERERVFKSRLSNLSFCFEDITTKGIAVIVTCDETEDFQILTIVWDVEDSERLCEGKNRWMYLGKFYRWIGYWRRTVRVGSEYRFFWRDFEDEEERKGNFTLFVLVGDTLIPSVDIERFTERFFTARALNSYWIELCRELLIV